METKITNKGDWFLVEIVEKFEPVNSAKTQQLRRVTTWGNYHLIHASTPSQAYDKAGKKGKESNCTFINKHKMQMKSEFLGIGDLIPIYEDLEDGAEILWHDYGFISARNSEKIVQTKKELMTGLKLKQK